MCCPCVEAPPRLTSFVEEEQSRHQAPGSARRGLPHGFPGSRSTVQTAAGGMLGLKLMLALPAERVRIAGSIRVLLQGACCRLCHPSIQAIG